MTTMLPRAWLTIVAFVALGHWASGAAFAQNAPSVAVPTPSCEKPGEPPNLRTTGAGKEQAERKFKDWASKMKTYVDCLKRFIEEEQAAAAAHGKAVNTALEDFNNAIKTYNEQAEAARQ